MKVIFNLTLCLLLFSCKTANNLETGSISIPSEFDSNSTLQSIDSLKKNITDSSLSYQVFFKDSILLALIDEALAQNLDLKMMQARLIQAQANVVFTKGIRLPELGLAVTNGLRKFGDYTVDGVGNYDTQFSPNLTSAQQIPNPVPDYFSGIYTSWELDLWGRLKNQKKSAQERFLASEEARKLATAELITELSSQYIRLLALDQELIIVKQNIQLLENALAMIEAQMQSGRTTAIAVDLMSAQLLSTQNLYLDVERMILETENKINVLLGRYPEKVVRSSFKNDDYALTKLENGIPSEMLNFRPDIQEAEHRLNAANADIQSAKAAFYPSIVLSGSIGLQAFRANVLLDLPASLAYNVIGGLTQPLLNRRQLKANLLAEEGKQKEAYLNYEKVVLKSFTEVYELFQFQSKLEEMSLLKQQEVNRLSRSAANVEELFLSGRCTYLEIYTAQATYLKTQIELLNIQQMCYFNEIKLYKAMGGAWR